MTSITSNDLLVLRKGDEASITRVFQKYDVQTFADLTGDNNPIHLDEAYAATTPFKHCIVHGKLVEGLVSAVLGTELPGPSSIFRTTTAKFHAPVYLGEQITATVRVRGLAPGKDNWVILDFWVRTRTDEFTNGLVLSGEVVMTLPKGKLDFRSS